MTAEIIRDLPFEDYVALPGLHWTRLGDARTSLLLYHHRDSEPRPDTADLKVGRAWHEIMLLPDFADRFVVYRESKTKGEGAKKRWQEFQEDAEAKGQTVLDAKEYDACMTMRAACYDCPDTLRLLAQIEERELTIVWTHEPSGELCKCRADGLALSLPPGLLVDLKKTRHQTLRQFFRDATEYGYHAQLAMYQDAVHAATGERVPAKLLVAQSLAPWDRFVVNMPDEVLQVGRSVYEDCIAQVQRARESGVWPGLAPDGPVDFELPAYAMPTDDDPTGLGLDWGTDEGSDSDE